MAATSQNAVGRACHVEIDSDDPYDTAKTGRHPNKPVLIGHSHGELGRFTDETIGQLR